MIARRDERDPVAQWQAAKRAATRHARRAPATITHHHAVGADHAAVAGRRGRRRRRRRAARRQGPARPRRDHEPRQAAELTWAPLTSGQTPRTLVDPSLRCRAWSSVCVTVPADLSPYVRRRVEGGAAPERPPRRGARRRRDRRGARARVAGRVPRAAARRAARRALAQRAGAAVARAVERCQRGVGAHARGAGARPDRRLPPRSPRPAATATPDLACRELAALYVRARRRPRASPTAATHATSNCCWRPRPLGGADALDAEGNARALAFYARFGFAPDGTRRADALATPSGNPSRRPAPATLDGVALTPRSHDPRRPQLPPPGARHADSSRASLSGVGGARRRAWRCHTSAPSSSRRPRPISAPTR